MLCLTTAQMSQYGVLAQWYNTSFGGCSSNYQKSLGSGNDTGKNECTAYWSFVEALGRLGCGNLEIQMPILKGVDPCQALLSKQIVLTMACTYLGNTSAGSA